MPSAQHMTSITTRGNPLIKSTLVRTWSPTSRPTICRAVGIADRKRSKSAPASARVKEGTRSTVTKEQSFRIPSDPEPRAKSKKNIQLDHQFVGLTGSQIFHALMVEHDVRYVFGYPGGAILPVIDAIYNSEHLEFILPRHEQGAGHMAEGYARVSGKPGVVLVTSGPGATNIITPMQDALSDGVPLVVFCGQVPTRAIGTDAFQEANIIGISKPCTKWNVSIRDIQDLPRLINEAFEIATSGRPGPVLVELPKDVTAAILSEPIRSSSVCPLGSSTSRSPFSSDLAAQPSDVTYSQFLRVAKLINGAKRPLIYAGAGILAKEDGPAKLRELADCGNIPVTTSLHGLGAFDEMDPKSLHMLGMHGSAYANLAMQNADVVIALGARFDDRVTGNVPRFAPEARRAATEKRGGFIHFEIMPRNINKVVPATEAVEGDVTENLAKLLPLIESSERREWFAKIAQWKDKYPFYHQQDPSGTLKPQTVIQELNKQTEHNKEKVIITTGVGQHQMWAAQYFRWRHPRSFVTSGGLGTMGYGLPSAIGAKIARPDCIVVDIDGDASFCMTGMELATAAQYGVGVKVLILNNSFQGMVKQWQDLFYGKRYSNTAMFNPDFIKLAESMGFEALRCSSMNDLPNVMSKFLACKGPILLEAVVDEHEHVFPIVPPGAALDEFIVHPHQEEANRKSEDQINIDSKLTMKS